MISRSMSRLARHGALSLLAALTLGSCVQDQDFLIIERAVWFDTDDESCVMSASGPSRLASRVDVSLESQFGIGLVVTNELVPNDNSNSGIDDSEIVIETAEVDLSFSGGSVSGGSFELTLPSNSIPGGGSDVVLIRIPADVAASLHASMAGRAPNEVETLEMEVVITGHRNQFGDRKLGAIESRTFVYPFDICNGCIGIVDGCGFAQL